ncbi:MAG: hypothetical protein WD928_02630 [Gammaproteobacteria bacterium]
MTVLFVLVGAFLGAAIGAAPGLAAGIAIGFLAGRLRALGRAQQGLQTRLDELAGQLIRIARTPPVAGSSPDAEREYAGRREHAGRDAGRDTQVSNGDTGFEWGHSSRCLLNAGQPSNATET